VDVIIFFRLLGATARMLTMVTTVLKTEMDVSSRLATPTSLAQMLQPQGLDKTAVIARQEQRVILFCFSCSVALAL